MCPMKKLIKKSYQCSMYTQFVLRKILKEILFNLLVSTSYIKFQPSYSFKISTFNSTKNFPQKTTIQKKLRKRHFACVAK